MEHSIEFLPQNKQDDLHYLVNKVLEKLPETEMILLYGSYARNTFTDCGTEVKFGTEMTYRSDYDILVITSGITDRDAGQKLDNVDNEYYKNPDEQTPVQFINEDIENINEYLTDGRYFYVGVIEQGIMLYDSGKYKLVEFVRPLPYEKLISQSKEYFDEKFKEASEFLIDAQNAYDRGNYKRASFYLHQAAENYYHALILVYTQTDSKQHNLEKLSAAVKKYSDELQQVFPRDTLEERRLFKLIKKAYVDARYNPRFKVIREEIELLTPKLEKLKDITEKLCENRIREYEEEKRKEDNPLS